MLQKYAKENNFGNTRYYVDDGYTGTNFNRPGFQKMLEDCDLGYISTIIVKDMSRLGRNYLEVGNYTDSYFPDRNIRFIAINDCVDSADGENELAPFRNVMNEMYARDVSRKVRSAHRIRGNSGEPLGQPPYGYTKSPENKKRWIIEPEAANVVKNIFRMCLEGKGNETIARILQENRVKNCMAYWKEHGIGRGGKKTQPDPYNWKSSTIGRILSQQEYCGDVINFKTYSKSFKNKARLHNPKENWVIFKDVHEPIIERAVFEQVQEKILKTTKRRAPKPENAQKNMFCDLLYCADCRKKLWFHVNTINKEILYFSCSNYVKDYRGTCQTRHYIRADAVEQVVMAELRQLATFLVDDEENFADLLSRKTNSDIIREQKYLTDELCKAKSRIEKVAKLYEQLYEKNVEGTVTDEWFMELSRKYELERLKLRERISEIQEKLDGIDRTRQNKDMFIAAVRKFLEMKKLTAPLLRELIDHIEVHETEGVGKGRTQRLVIHYRFIGCIDIPAHLRKENIKANLRKGVAVEYIPSPATA